MPLSIVPAEVLIDVANVNLPGVGDHETLLRTSSDIRGQRIAQLLSVGRRNETHVRSFILGWDNMPEELGDVTLKGAEWTEPRIFRKYPVKSRSEYFGGSQLGEAMAAFRVSEVLDNTGIYGERILKVCAPEVVPIGETMLPWLDAVRQLVDDAYKVPQIARRFYFSSDARPVTVLRHAPTDVRLRDIPYAETLLDAGKLLQIGMNRAGQINADYSGMTAAAKKDIEDFFASVLPRLYATQMGKLTVQGMWQPYSHAGNIAIDGGLMDLGDVAPQNGLVGNTTRFLLEHHFYSHDFTSGTARVIRRFNDLSGGRSHIPVGRIATAAKSEFKRAYHQALKSS